MEVLSDNNTENSGVDSSAVILVVDDNKANVKLLSNFLLKKGYRVITAGGGGQGVELFDQQHPDLVLMDVMMPDMDGHEATRRIKSMTGENHVPVIFVTALKSEEALREAIDSGGDDYISKPLDFDVLQSKIRAQLRIRELNQKILEKHQALQTYNSHLQQEYDYAERFFEKAIQRSYMESGLINYHMTAATAYNGDILLVEQGLEGNLYMIVGDFTGHGLPAAMGMLSVSQIFFRMVEKGMTIQAICYELNHQIKAILPTGIFCAAAIVELHANGKTLDIWVGGAPECYWTDAEGNLKGVLESRHPALGLMSKEQFKGDFETLTVEKNDKFYFYSDGLVEARNSSGEMFYYERIKDVLRSGSKDPVNALIGALSNFCGDTKYEDDVSIVELKVDSVPPRLGKT